MNENFDKFTNKMNSLLSKLIDPNLVGGQSNNSNPLSSREEIKPKLKYKHWCAAVEKKVHQIIQSVQTLESNLGGSEEKKKEKAIQTYQKLITIITELNQSLEITQYKSSSSSSKDKDNDDSPPSSSFSPSANNIGTTTSSNLNQVSQNLSKDKSEKSEKSNNEKMDNKTGNNNHNGDNHSPLSGSGQDYSTATSPSSSLSSSISNSNSSSSSGLLTSYRDLTSGGSASSNGKDIVGLRSTKVITHSCRDSLLSLWLVLLSFVEKYHSIDKDLTLLYQCILLICRRREYDSSISTIDPITQRPWSLSSNDVLAKYRRIVHKTFSFVATILSSPLFFSIPLTHFCSKFLSASFFRIPKVARLILEALTPPETEIQDIIANFPIPNNLKHLMVVGDKPDKAPFHYCLMQMGSNSNNANSNTNTNNSNSNNNNNSIQLNSSYNNNNNSINFIIHPNQNSINIQNSNNIQNNNNNNNNNNINNFLTNSIIEEFSIDNIPQGWVDNLARKESVFFIFFKDWFTSCKYVLGESVDMKTIPGFFTITYALLHEIKTRDQAQPPLSKPTPSLDAQLTLIQCCRQDNIIDVMIKTIFLKTCVFDLSVVSTTLALVEVWLKEFGPLLDNFDINFFCEGIESIIVADHHQVLIRALQMLYNTSECFQRNLRKVLFADLLLGKYFYQLFLHWDQPVRNAYHHLLLYKMVRINRSKLYESGASLQEFSKLTHANTPANTRSALSPTKFIESKDDNHNYSSSSRLADSLGGKENGNNTNHTTNNAASTTNGKVTSTLNGASSRIGAGSNNNTQNKIGGNRKVPPPVPPRSYSNGKLIDDKPTQDPTNNNASPATSPSSSPSNNSSSPLSSSTNHNVEPEDSFVIIDNPSTTQDNESPNSGLTITASNSPSLAASLSSDSSNAKDTQTKKPLPKLPLSAITEKFNKEYSLDIKLFFEIEVLTKKVQDQMRCPELKFHDPILSHYVASSISEFKTYIAHSNQVDATPPKIIPLMFANSNHIINYKD